MMAIIAEVYVTEGPDAGRTHIWRAMRDGVELGRADETDGRWHLIHAEHYSSESWMVPDDVEAIVLLWEVHRWLVDEFP